MNTQKPQKPFSHSNGHVHVHSIFATIQGEGIFAGEPATFIRLAGCNLKCPACDTEYTDESKFGLCSPAWVVRYVDAVTSPNRLVVITGGEPFRQDLNALIGCLLARNYRIQIETNGTMAPSFNTEFYRGVYIMCSPKINRLHKELIPHISAYKYVVGYTDVDVIDGLPNRVLGLRAKPARPPKGNTKPVYIQPMDSKDADVNYKHLTAAVQSSLTYGYTLCLQIHKIIDVE
ncbi:7-carboxy-7-deazaguanine synthase [Vibrio phage vB_VpaS_CHI]|nr:7-carboxy-7-deazaguanine synthase [Vibrio phage vB_VpaS_ALK]USL90105.1 7-carboxy-7-deazaguanine synthase [Vibrio phage vB_VpaS_CHI]